MVETWLHALDIKSCWRVIATVVLNGGDSANSTSVQRLTPTRIQTQAGRYENRPRTHAKRLNRDSVVLGVGKPSERAEGRQKRETRLKSDSPNWSRNLRSYVKFNVTTGRRSLSMTGLGASSLEA